MNLKVFIKSLLSLLFIFILVFAMKELIFYVGDKVGIAIVAALSVVYVYLRYEEGK